MVPTRRARLRLPALRESREVSQALCGRTARQVGAVRPQILTSAGPAALDSELVGGDELHLDDVLAIPLRDAESRRPSGIIRLGFALLTTGMLLLVPIVPRADSGWCLVVAGSGSLICPGLARPARLR